MSAGNWRWSWPGAQSEGWGQRQRQRQNMLERELLKSANRRLGRSTMGAWAMLYGVSLICVLDLGQQSIAEEPSCGPGRVRNGTGTNTRCCSLCGPGKARRVGVRIYSSALPCTHTRRWTQGTCESRALSPELWGARGTTIIGCPISEM